jgi:uncharacterized RDD family membrane protein YckC
MVPSIEIQAGPGSSGLATVRDRFAAQVIDALVCGLLFWYPAIRTAEHFGKIGVSLPLLAIQVSPGMLAAGIFVLATFAYFVFMEWLAGGTAGKLLCRLRVVKPDRDRCGFVSALVRNFTRPADLLPGPWLLLLSRKRQRLGDRIAETVVIKLPRREPVPLKLPEFATWEQRAQAAILDLVLLAILTCAYIADTRSLSAAHQLGAALDDIALLALPVFLFAYYAAMEATFGATIGKMLTRLRVVHLNGEPCDFTAATIRTLLRPLETATAYLPSILLVKFTRNRQRFGDIVAGSSVARTPEVHPAGPWAAGVLAAIAVSLVAHAVATGRVRELLSLAVPH